MSKLFEPISFNKLTIKNCFVLSAADDNLTDNIPMRIKRFSALAEGQIGLIISGGTRPNRVETWSEIIAAVHKKEGKIAIQLVVESGPGSYMGYAKDDEDKIAASVLPEDHIYFKSMDPFVKYGKHHAATDAEFESIIQSYVNAALTAKKIGADAIQIHAAHQNFLSQMLSPITNKRTDQWGGSIENRIRLHREVYKAVRAAVGADFPVLIKLGVEDAIPNGLQFAEGKIAAKLIAECGYDAIEISQGLQSFQDWSYTPMRENILSSKDEAYFQNWCKEIKSTITKPTILTGGIRSFEVVEKLVTNGVTDCIGMCRSFIREPNLIKRWHEGDRQKATCISCNKCLTELFFNGKPLECFLDLEKK